MRACCIRYLGILGFDDLDLDFEYEFGIEVDFVYFFLFLIQDNRICFYGGFNYGLRVYFSVVVIDVIIIFILGCFGLCLRECFWLL